MRSHKKLAVRKSPNAPIDRYAVHSTQGGVAVASRGRARVALHRARLRNLIYSQSESESTKKTPDCEHVRFRRPAM
ncbi:hypothetical protein EVAR_21241_1 [Eumeta japonica]|uniref:Uncharacterized protein n=1 Tax=Eumeta variegata TaxID=151549 RepID=A0A4C1YYQ0_EUMVA|nr:hypothetical protein EVAR_21241_1 [Eumeta japonica]